MYVGRIVAVGRTRAGRNAALYRVSSRSFPNRKATEIGGSIAIVPREGHESDLEKSPYISYNCLRQAAGHAVASNGSQTDPIVEKIEAGLPVRDALASVLLALDYERDDYDTPRIAAVTPLEGETAWLGCVRRDGLVVRELELRPGQAVWLATYEASEIDPGRVVAFDAADAGEAAQASIDGPGFAELEKPVTAAAALSRGRGFELATRSV